MNAINKLKLSLSAVLFSFLWNECFGEFGTVSLDDLPKFSGATIKRAVMATISHFLSFLKLSVFIFNRLFSFYFHTIYYFHIFIILYISLLHWWLRI